MTWTVYALLVAIIALFVVLWYAWEEVYLANRKIDRLQRRTIELENQLETQRRAMQSLKDIKSKQFFKILDLEAKLKD